MTGDISRVNACLSDAEFEDLARGALAAPALEALRAGVQAVLDDPSEGVSHDEVWGSLEQRMKRAARAA